MAVSYSLRSKEPKTLYNDQAFETEEDFDSIEDLRAGVKRTFSNFKCTSCGSGNVSGEGVSVFYCAVRLVRDEEKSGFFGKYYEKVLWKTVYRVEEIFLESSGFVSSAGYVKCRTCGWSLKGGKGRQTHWLTVGDVIRMFK